MFVAAASNGPVLRAAPLTRAAVTTPLLLEMAAPRRKASELKRILQAAGVSTAGIIEKEELEGTMDEMEKRIDALEGEGEEKDKRIAELEAQVAALRAAMEEAAANHRIEKDRLEAEVVVM